SPRAGRRIRIGGNQRKSFCPAGTLLHLSKGEMSSASQVCLGGRAGPSVKAEIFSSIPATLLSAAKIGEIQTKAANRTATVRIVALLGCIQVVDETAVVDGAEIVQIPRLHGPDTSHGRIFPDVEVVDVLDRAGQRIRFFRQQLRPLPLEVDIVYVVFL